METETALDVLSRAASMVETNDKNAQDPLYKGVPLPPPPPPPQHDRSPIDHSAEHIEPADHRSSPGKQLPTKQHKHDRHKERLELTKPLNFDKDHALQHQHRQMSSASTPTQIHSVAADHYRNGEASTPEAYSIHHHQLRSQSIPSHQSTPPHPPPRYPHPHPHIDLHTHHEGPLNLSITNSSCGANGVNTKGTSASLSPTQSRPSVICATSASGNGRYENGSSGSSSPVRRENSTDICDPAIEEHFRRSLGQNYSEFLGKHPSVTPSPPPPPPPPPPQLPPSLPPVTSAPILPPLAARQSSPTLTIITTGTQMNANVSITGAVDDHFARALGNSTWSALKAQNDPSEAPSPGSVDDHFAKALGDTWLRIKAERESPRGPPPPFPMTHHSLAHPHTVALPLPQRPSSPSTQSHSTSLLST